MVLLVAVQGAGCIPAYLFGYAVGQVIVIGQSVDSGTDLTCEAIVLRENMNNPMRSVVGILLVCGYGCCPDAGRDWSVTGRVVDGGGQPIAGAEVEVMFWFAIDGPGNRSAEPVVTDADGRFLSRVRFTASCAPAMFFGTEARNTAVPPGRLDVTVRADGSETKHEFDVRFDPDVTVTRTDVPGFGIEGTIDLPTIEVSEDGEPPP